MEDGIPAWMVCAEILNKAKTELVTQAMDAIDEQEKSGNIAIKGSIIEQPDKPSDTETKLFIINKMLKNSDEIRERCSRYVHDTESKKNPKPNDIQNVERARKLLMSIDNISLLMHYVHILDAWINEVSMMVKLESPSEILKSTSQDSDRKDLLAMLLKNRKIREERILTDREQKILENAVSA